MSLNDQFSTLTSQVNIYDIFGICWGSGPYPQAEPSFPHLYKGGKRTHQQYISAADYTPWLPRFQKKGSKLNELPPCTFGSSLLDYMNSDAVREAMHIPDYVQAWDLCKTGIDYLSGQKGSQWIYEYFADKKDIRMLHYSGDTDGAVPTVGTQNWIASLNWNKTSEWKQYTVEGQVGGYWEAYEGGLTFGTVHGAGHMAPQFKPPQTYHLVFGWMFDRDI